MKQKVFLLFVFLFYTWSIKAQINIEAIVVDNGSLSPEVASVLESKVQTLMSQNGIVGSSQGSRFVLAVKADIVNKEVLATAPTQYMQHLMLRMLIADGVTGNTFSSINLEVKGVGKTEQASLMNAARNINSSHPQLQAFFHRAIFSIKDYYDKNAASIVSKIKNLSNLHQYEQAIYEFSLIPYESKAYSASEKLINEIYKNYLKQSSEQALSLMSAAWASSPNEVGAQEVYDILQELPQSNLNYPPIKQLLSKIEREMTRQQKTKELLEVKKLSAAVELSKARLHTMERIAKIYAEKQPPRIYHYSFD